MNKPITEQWRKEEKKNRQQIKIALKARKLKEKGLWILCRQKPSLTICPYKDEATSGHLQHTLQAVQGGEWGTLCSGKNRQNRPSDREIFFRRRFYEPSFVHCLLSKKALKSLTETPAVHDQHHPSGDQQHPSTDMCAWWQLTSFTKITCTLTSPSSLGSSSSELSERLSPRLWSSFCPQ